jgi:hypothetical protein
MGIACWRRQHGEDLVAPVVEMESGEYEAAVWDEPSTPLRRVPRTFRHLESAKAAADGAGWFSIDALGITAVIGCSGTKREIWRYDRVDWRGLSMVNQQRERGL